MELSALFLLCRAQTLTSSSHHIVQPVSVVTTLKFDGSRYFELLALRFVYIGSLICLLWNALSYCIVLVGLLISAEGRLRSVVFVSIWGLNAVDILGKESRKVWKIGSLIQTSSCDFVRKYFFSLSNACLRVNICEYIAWWHWRFNCALIRI